MSSTEEVPVTWQCLTHPRGRVGEVTPDFYVCLEHHCGRSSKTPQAAAPTYEQAQQEVAIAKEKAKQTGKPVGMAAQEVVSSEVASEVITQARRRFFGDAEFAARVHEVVQIADLGSFSQIDSRSRGLIEIAASIAFVMSEKSSS